MRYVRNFPRWSKQLNMFKSSDNRTVDAIKQQRIITRTYLILLISMNFFKNLYYRFVILGSIIILLLFSSLNTQTVPTVVVSPSQMTYNYLQSTHSDTMKCPCSNVTMSYESFFKMNPIYHQVCSSDLVSDSWISILIAVGSNNPKERWFVEAPRYFQLLLTLCQLVNQTISNGIDRVSRNTFATSYVITKSDFNNQFNLIFTQFIETMMIKFNILIDIIRTVIQIDQPLTISNNVPLIVNNITDKNTNEEMLQVC